jgi:TolB-like protein
LHVRRIVGAATLQRFLGTLRGDFATLPALRSACDSPISRSSGISTGRRQKNARHWRRKACSMATDSKVDGAERRDESSTDAALSLWDRIREHKIIQWVIAYLGAAFALAGAQEQFAHAFQWPDIIGRILLTLLVIGLPLAVTAAWYHGHRGLRTVSSGELAIASCLLLIGGLLFTALVHPFSKSTAAPNAVPAANAAPSKSAPSRPDDKPATPNSIAVLPFRNLTGDDTQEYFVDGLTEEILNALSQSKNLRVVGRTSSFAFKNRNEDLRVIGEMLGVENVLEGSVRRSGDIIRVTAVLNNARTGFHYWSKEFNKQLDDFLKIQQEVAEAVAESLQVSLGTECMVCPGMTRNVAAWDEFRLANSTDLNTPDGVNSAISHLERAVRIDPDFGMAWIALNNAYVTASNVNPINRQYQLQMADEAFQKAAKISPNAPGVLRRQAINAVGRKNWVEAGQLFEKARPNPGEQVLLANLDKAAFRVRLGFVKSAIVDFEQARAIEPLDPGVSLFLALLYAFDENYAASLAESERGLNIGPPDLLARGNALLAAMTAKDREAMEVWNSRVKAIPAGNMGPPAQLSSMLDSPNQARELLRTYSASAQNNTLATHLITAEWAMYFGETDLALDNLEMASRMTNPWNFYWIWHPVFKSLRSHERFKSIVTDLGMVDYWRATGKWGEFCKPAGEDDFVCA